MPATTRILRVPRGFDVPLEGLPGPGLAPGPRLSRVGLRPADFRGLRLRPLVREGDAVRTGTPLLGSKDDPRLVLLSPGAGRVAEFRHGERRALLEVAVELSGEEAEERLEARDGSRSETVASLLRGGLWPLLRRRPYGTTPSPDEPPRALFVSAMRADPFEPDPAEGLRGAESAFRRGLEVLRGLTDGGAWLCSEPGLELPEAEGWTRVEVRGRYPAGNAGAHVFHLDRPGPGESAWCLYWQDVVAVGRFFQEGRHPAERLVALGGPGMRGRGTVRTRVGAAVEELVRGRLAPGPQRLVSGGLLTGTRVEPSGFLGWRDTALCAAPEGEPRRLLGFLRPGLDQLSFGRGFLSSLLPGRRFALSTSRRGSRRAFVQTLLYGEVCPVGIWPDFLAKALLAGDLEEAEQHGLLDCVECGLCAFVDPSKNELGAIIEDGLAEHRRESGG